jgi:hypothetical protein
VEVVMMVVTVDLLGFTVVTTCRKEEESRRLQT